MDQAAFEPVASDSAESAARDLRASCEAVRASRPELGLARQQRAALEEWASKGRILKTDCLVGIRRVSSGAEHEVFFDEAGRQAVKITHPNAFGHSPYGPGSAALPLEYFERLAYQNVIFGDEIKIHGLLDDGEGHVQIVTTQPWISTNKERPNPTLEEIDAFFRQESFERVPLFPDAPLFYSQELGLLVADAHDQNVLRDGEGNLVPIDLVIGVPGPKFRAEILKSLVA